MRPPPRHSERLPPLLERARLELGAGAALRIAKELGGQSFYLPRRIRREHRIAERVGLRALRWLVETLGGGRQVTIPLGDRARRAGRIAALLRAGHAPNEVARRVGCSVGTVYSHRATIRRAASAAEGGVA